MPRVKSEFKITFRAMPVIFDCGPVPNEIELYLVVVNTTQLSHLGLGCSQSDLVIFDIQMFVFLVLWLGQKVPFFAALSLSLSPPSCSLSLSVSLPFSVCLSSNSYNLLIKVSSLCYANSPPDEIT